LQRLVDELDVPFTVQDQNAFDHAVEDGLLLGFGAGELVGVVFLARGELAAKLAGFAPRAGGADGGGGGVSRGRLAFLGAVRSHSRKGARVMDEEVQLPAPPSLQSTAIRRRKAGAPSSSSFVGETVADSANGDEVFSSGAELLTKPAHVSIDGA